MIMSCTYVCASTDADSIGVDQTLDESSEVSKDSSSQINDDLDDSLNDEDTIGDESIDLDVTVDENDDVQDDGGNETKDNIVFADLSKQPTANPVLILLVVLISICIPFRRI